MLTFFIMLHFEAELVKTNVKVNISISDDRKKIACSPFSSDKIQRILKTL